MAFLLIRVFVAMFDLRTASRKPHDILQSMRMTLGHTPRFLDLSITVS
jgi:hypothetical protein